MKKAMHLTPQQIVAELDEYIIGQKAAKRSVAIATPEKRTRDLEEKELGLHATNWIKEKLEGAVAGDDDLIIRTELVGGVGKYGRLLGCHMTF